jgi:hypothetical protein
VAGAAASTGTLQSPAWGHPPEGPASPLKVTSIEVIPVKVPAVEDAGASWVFVKLLTNRKGLVGYGEVYTLGIPFGPSNARADD